MWYFNCVGTIIEGPSNVTYLPGLTPLPIELTCNITGVAVWRVNGSYYFLNDLTSGLVPGHNATGTNILVNSPVNNTEYICALLDVGGNTESDPAYIIIAGEYGVLSCVFIVYVTLKCKLKLQLNNRLRICEQVIKMTKNIVITHSEATSSVTDHRCTIAVVDLENLGGYSSPQNFKEYKRLNAEARKAVKSGGAN